MRLVAKQTDRQSDGERQAPRYQVCMGRGGERLIRESVVRAIIGPRNVHPGRRISGSGSRSDENV